MPIFLDTETTGFSPANGDAIVEVAIVDDHGRILVDSLVDPGRPIPWRATEVHGITDAMVRGKPTLARLIQDIDTAIAGQTVVIYNATFDVPFFPNRLNRAAGIECAMRRFAEAMDTRWWKLADAARHVGHRWSGDAHRALADTLACRSVWQWLEQRPRRGL